MRVRFHAFAAALAAALLATPALLAQTGTPFVRLPINPGTEGSDLTEIHPAGPGRAYVVHGSFMTRSLWLSDGTADGTREVVPVPPQTPPVSETVGEVAVVGTDAYYVQGSASTSALYRRTLAGTRTEVHRVQGTLGSLVAVGEGVYAVWQSPSFTRTLLRIDASGVRQLGPLTLGGPGSYADLNGRFVFAGTNASGVTELWASDGTLAGTARLTTAAGGGTNPRGLARVGGTVFFVAYSAAHGNELWATDGTPAGTRLVKDIQAGTQDSHPSGFVAFGDRLLFSATTAATGREPWTSDGTDAGTRMIREMVPGTAGFTGGGGVVATASGRPLVVFSASDDASGWELWTSDGTTIARLADLNPGAASSNPEAFVALGGRVYFKADDGTSGLELWTSDGTAAGTARVKDVHPLAGQGSLQSGTLRPFVAGPDRLWFAADDGTHGAELWTSDGTEAGTRLAKDATTKGVIEVSTTAESAVAGTRLFFFGIGPGTGAEPWVTDGTAAGTRLLKDVTPGPASTDGQMMGRFGDKVYFWTRTSSKASPTAPVVYKYDLHATDGTEAGTVRAVEGIDRTNAFAEMAALGDGRAVVRCTQNAASLCVTSGAAGNLTVLKNFFTAPAYLTPFKGGVLFAAGLGSTPSLWWTDGTPDGTAQLHGVSPQTMHVWGDAVYFRGSQSATGSELWKTDGTTVGTVLVKDLNPGSSGSLPGPFAVLNGALYFGALTPGTGHELWRSDGTAAGTLLVADVNPGTAGSGPNSLTRAGDRLVFTATTPETGFELWTSDGTAAGTTLLYDINPGGANAEIYTLAAAGSHAVFVARDATGQELWQTDGTPEGTRIAFDPSGDVASSAARLLGVAGQTVFVAATDGVNGMELWAGTVGTPVAANASDAPASAALAVWPQPARERVAVRLTSLHAGAATVRVVDLVGRERARLDRTVEAGTATFDLSTAALAPGLYVVRAELPGGAVRTHRLVVVR